MLDYNTLNNLVEIFKKNGIKNIELESGSTIEVKEGALLVNGEGVGVSYTAGTGIVISDENAIGVDTDTVALKSDIPTDKHLYLHTINIYRYGSGNDNETCLFSIITDSDTPFTSAQALYNWLFTNIKKGSYVSALSVQLNCQGIWIDKTDPDNPVLYNAINLTSISETQFAVSYRSANNKSHTKTWNASAMSGAVFYDAIYQIM